MPADSHWGIRREYDVIVVGSGLAGLTAAYRLAQAGFSVLILEKHHLIGGLATYFRRPGGIIFDVSLHGFPRAMRKSLSRYWGEELAGPVTRLEDIRFDNPQFQLSTSFDVDDVRTLLVDRFHVSEAQLERFWQTICRRQFFDDWRLSTRQMLEEFFPGQPEVIRFLLEPICYANGSNEDDPAVTFAVVLANFLRGGVYSFLGGTDRFVNLLRDKLRQANVDIRTSSRVEKIIVHKRHVQGVQVNGRIIRAQAVLSNAHLLATVFELVEPDEFGEDFLQEARTVRPACSSTQVYLAFQPGYKLPRKELGDLLFRSKEKDFSPSGLSRWPPSSRTYTFYYHDFRPGHPRCYAVSSTNARYEDWANLSPADYQSAKSRLIEETICDLEELVPDVRKAIDWAEAATPRTFARYTGHPEGANFGTKYEGLAISRAIPRQIAGLFHAGSVGILMSGYLGTVNYGVLVASEVEAFLKRLPSPNLEDNSQSWNS
ncbi:MAG: NAD(P)/FAD-dependent oxidoreductase [Thermoguttaceae bacterium]|nr:NAD(P)/FAD-dependent oxidoreductase [Thermoguttaceae bacterium]MDW8079941.1 NAD(P)/FAD-dependent oxidoreductase [Thermoguttaceae bacterium]